jgi:hypothetical protein
MASPRNQLLGEADRKEVITNRGGVQTPRFVQGRYYGDAVHSVNRIMRKKECR